MHNGSHNGRYGTNTSNCRNKYTNIKVISNLKLNSLFVFIISKSLSKGCHLDVVRGPSTPHDTESDAGGSLSSWQSHPSR
jgi:hypothetical protein